MALSENFEREIARREKPGCYGKFKITSESDKKKCGMCWFAHHCKENKKLPSQKKEVKK